MLYRRQAVVKRTMLSNSKQHSQKKIQADVAKATTEECKHDFVARRRLENKGYIINANDGMGRIINKVIHCKKTLN